MVSYPDASSSGRRIGTPDSRGHMHTAGFSHGPRTKRAGFKHIEGLIERTPREDAGINEVRSWVLEIFNRRCHPDPERVLNEFFWKGRDLHSQRRYLALRLRFRGEPYGYMIAHDIHDAVQESRKRARKREKEARKQKKKGRKTKGGTPPSISASVSPSPHLQIRESVPRKDKSTKAKKEQASSVNVNREPGPTPALEKDQSPEAKSSTTRAKAKTIFATIFAPNSKIASSRGATPAVASPPAVEDPFRDPSPELKKTKTKTTKLARKKKWKRPPASPESLGSPRDPEPMHLIDADDFRLESPENADYDGAAQHTWGLGYRTLGCREKGKVKGMIRQNKTNVR
ncbi:hypothetical protein F5Y01DRAFT_316613 [Xylaria sp. FL0043]|nr:hypothetical protein F5Y01DRAFT_316613 [Xylaria sp. FL0043]